MKNWLIILAILSYFGTAQAGEWRLLEPEEISIDVYKNEIVHDPYLHPIDKGLSYGSNFNVNLDLIKYNEYALYWKNILHFDQSSQDGRIKHAGWQYELGLSLFRQDGQNKIELFKQHHSRHILEDTRDAHFPVYDRYGVRLIIFRR